MPPFSFLPGCWLLLSLVCLPQISFSFQFSPSNRVSSPILKLKASEKTTIEEGVTVTPSRELDEFDYNYESFRSGFFTCQEEVCVLLNGEVPKDMCGTYFRNGPAKYEIGSEKQPVLHPFDGDGMILAAQFKDGEVIFRNRFVETEGFKKEKTAKRALYRNSFTQKKGGILANIFDIKPKNVANTNVVYRAGRLFALWEAGLPHKLSPDSLETTGEDTIDGVLDEGMQFSAHPRVDGRTGNLINFAVSRTGNKLDFSIYEFDQNMKVESTRKFEMPGFAFIHDFIVTDNYYIFSQSPTTFDLFKFLSGMKAAVACVGFDPNSPAKVHLVPRHNNGEVEVVEVDPHFNFHFANAFDDGVDKVYFDVIKAREAGLEDVIKDDNKSVLDTIDFETDVPFSILERYTLERDSLSGTWSYSFEPLTSFHTDFPVINPCVSTQKHQIVFGSCGSKRLISSPLQGLFKLDMKKQSYDVWYGSEDEFLGECSFVPRKSKEGEDDGYLVSMLWNGQSKTSELVIFDAKNISRGPITRLLTPTAIPIGLHGCWADGLAFDKEQIFGNFKVN